MEFDQQKFERFLSVLRPARNLDQLLFVFERVSSTNTVLWEKLAAGAPIGTVVIAAQQTAGRGQWGRTWISPLGGLYLSIAIGLNLPAHQSARLTLASAWGIAIVLRSHQIPVLLKWPNDLYMLNKKLGGILTETTVQHSMIQRAVVGVGINWTNESIETAIALKTSGVAISPPIRDLEHLAALVVGGIDLGMLELQERELASIMPDYRQWLYQSLPPEIDLQTL